MVDIPLIYQQAWGKQAVSMAALGYVILESTESGDLFPGFFRDADAFPDLEGTGYTVHSVVFVSPANKSCDKEKLNEEDNYAC